MILDIKQYQELELKEKLTHCIQLFEIFIEKKEKNKDWTFVLNTMNEINTSDYLDEWFYKYCEILPTEILDEKSDIEDCEYINLNQLNSLKYLYKRSQNIIEISKFMNSIHEIGSIELYTNSKQVSVISFNPYLDIVHLIES